MLIEFYQRLRNQIKDGEVQLVASSLAYSTVLSLIPFIAVTLAILQRQGGLESLYPKVEKLILSNFSETAGSEGIKLIRAAISRLQSGRLGTLGAIVLVLTATRLVHEMEMGINRVWNLKIKRSLLQRLFFYWLFILVLPFGLATWVAVNTSREISELQAQLPTEYWKLILLFFILSFVYKLVPNLKVRWVAALTGAAVGSTVVVLIHRLLIWSSHEVFNYGKFYGSLAAIPLLLIWVLLLWHGILIGAAVSASFRHQKGRL